MTENHTCPRRVEDGTDKEGVFVFAGEDRDEYTERDWGSSGRMVRGCTYCGSMHQDDVMAGLEDGTLAIGPTDKSYKAYIQTSNTQPISETYLGGKQIGKFYYQHLSVEQRKRFVDMHNAGLIQYGYPGHLYRMPFFMGRAAPSDA